MSDILHAIASGLRLAILFGCSASLFALGIACTCRWLKWAPVNITLNVHVTKDDIEVTEPSGERGK